MRYILHCLMNVKSIGLHCNNLFVSMVKVRLGNLLFFMFLTTIFVSSIKFRFVECSYTCEIFPCLMSLLIFIGLSDDNLIRKK